MKKIAVLLCDALRANPWLLLILAWINNSLHNTELINAVTKNSFVLHFLLELRRVFKVRLKRIFFATEPGLLSVDFACEFEEVAGASGRSCVIGNLPLLDIVKLGESES